MNTVKNTRSVLQVPINALLREKAENMALEEGYSSLQELLRVLVTKYTKGEFNLIVTGSEIKHLTKEQSLILDKKAKVVRYEIAKGKAMKAKNISDLRSVLMD